MAMRKRLSFLVVRQFAGAATVRQADAVARRIGSAE
jgi:hypothetical protein